ncbi:hypothetical protein TrLO_g7344 [Triparma laevis f. longispina]|uniref:Protein kinase domain-containing protein n=1 Tax=Triparma laevis f. longispina TaxID=1714387 RepID=A0A9W7FMJ5_9STRA|nr:hypothetical protein TrLO_g7344 [Triparma laevis f. longispina]
MSKTLTLPTSNTKVKISSLLAEGGNGFVYSCTIDAPSSSSPKSQKSSLFSSFSSQPRLKTALKKMLCLEDSMMESAKMEIEVMQKINHENVVNLLQHEIVNTPKKSDENYPNPYVLVLCPLYEGGSLEDFVTSGHFTCDPLALLTGIVTGLFQINSAGYRHNDVKPANVLLKIDTQDEDAPPTPAITDFGSCGPAEVKINNRKEALMAMDFHSRATTAPYRAPELWDIPSSPHSLTHKSDSFSVGCILYFMLFKKPAFDFNVGKPVLPHTHKYFGDFATELTLALLINDPDHRLSFSQTLEAIASKSIPAATRSFLEGEFKTELKIERGDFSKKTSSPKPVEKSVDFADFASFSSSPTAMREAPPRPQRNSIDEGDWGSFQGSPEQTTTTSKPSPLTTSMTTHAPPATPVPPSPSSKRRKGAAKMLRPRGWGINGRKLVMKTVWVSLTTDALTLHKTALDTSKEHMSLKLAETEFLDVSLGHVVEEGSEQISEVGAKAGEACFVISYSDPGSETGGGEIKE